MASIILPQEGACLSALGIVAKKQAVARQSIVPWDVMTRPKLLVRGHKLFIRYEALCASLSAYGGPEVK